MLVNVRTSQERFQASQNMTTFSPSSKLRLAAVSLKASCVLEDESMVLMGNISILTIRLCVVQNTSNFFLSACFGDLIISSTHFNLIICGEQSNIIKAGMITIFSLSNKNVGRCNILRRVLIKI